MGIPNFVQVNSVVEARSPTRQGFGVPLIAGFHSRFPEFVRTYSDIDGMEADGFVATDPEHIAATALLSQGTNAAPAEFKIGRLANASTQQVKLTPTNTNEGAVYSIRIGSDTFTYTVPGAATVASIVTAIAALINGSAQAITAADNTTHITVTSNNAGELFGYGPISIREMDVEVETPESGSLATDLANIWAEDDAWYVLLLTSQGKPECDIATTFCSSRKLIHLCDTPDTDMLDPASTTDLAYTNSAAGNSRTAVAYHGITDEYFSAAWAGRLLPTTPGSNTWAFKGLSGVTFDALTTNQINALDGKDASYYIRCAGLNVTFDGNTGDARYIDEVRGVDHLNALIQENIFALKARVGKVPYTQSGIESVLGEVQAALDQKVTDGFLAAVPAPAATAPDVSAISTTDKAARCLPDVKYTATTAGAIHITKVSGRISV